MFTQFDTVLNKIKQERTRIMGRKGVFKIIIYYLEVNYFKVALGRQLLALERNPSSRVYGLWMQMREKFVHLYCWWEYLSFFISHFPTLLLLPLLDP